MTFVRKLNIGCINLTFTLSKSWRFVVPKQAHPLRTPFLEEIRQWSGNPEDPEGKYKGSASKENQAYVLMLVSCVRNTKENELGP